MFLPVKGHFHRKIRVGYTVCGSAVVLTEWPDVFPNRILGAATIDRLRHGAYKIVLDGKSYRTAQPGSGTQKQAVKEQKNKLRKEVKSPD